MADLTTIFDQPSTRPSLGFGNVDPVANATAAPSAWEQSEARRKREDAAQASDYMGSMWRQDSAIPGLIDTYAGSQFVPKEDYFAGTDPGFKDLSSGLWDENIKHLYQATSPEHAQFLKDRLLQKQEDLVRLGDMGWSGNAARFALGILAPDQLAMSMAGGWVTKGALAAQGYKSTKLAQAAAQASRVQAAGKGTAVAAGIGTAVVENAAYEKLRQSVSFEDDTAGVVEAGLMGALFASPFVAAGARADRRVANAARKEHEVLQALKTVQDGGELSPAQAATLREVHNTHKAINDLEAGRITPDEFNQRIDEFHGPVEPHDQWMARWGDQLKADTQSLIDQLFPLHKDPVKAPTVSPEMRAQMDARVAREDANFNRPASAPAEAGIQAPEWYNKQNPNLDSPMQAALRKALDKQTMQREASAKAGDLEALRTADMAAVQKSKEDAWAQAESERAARLNADHEAMILERELADAESPEVPSPEPVKAPAPSPEPTPEPPKPHPAESFVGRTVTGLDRHGEPFEGTITRWNPDLGKFIVQTSDGMKSIAPRDIDQRHELGLPGPDGFLHGSVGAAQVKAIANIMDKRTAMSKARLDYFAILNRSEHEGVRDLVFRLVKDAIQVDDKEAQGWTASEHKKQLQRVVGGNFHRELDAALHEAMELAKVPLWKRREFTQQFMALVSRETRGDWTVRVRHRDIHPAVAKASKAMKDAYARMLDEAQRAGVKGAQDVAPNDAYVNRMWDYAGIRNAIVQHGEDAVVNLLARAINVPGHIGDRVKAKQFLDVVRKLEHNPALQNVHLQGRDMHTLRSELAHHGLSKADIDTLVDVMFDARAASDGDAGQTARLKFRFDIDENAAVNLRTGVLRVSDLFENDARVLVDSYINSMGGHIGLAKVGIDSQAEWAARLKEIGDEAGVNNPAYDGKQLAKELKLLQDIHNHITGRPMDTSDFSNSARIAAALRGYTRSATLGQLGLTAAMEMARSVSLMGFRAMWQSAPSFRNFIKALRSGYVPDKQLADDVMAMTGFGTEMASAYARAHELEGGFVGGAISRFEKLSNDLSHASDVLSGNAGFTSVTRNMTAQAAVRDAFRYAQKGTVPDALRKRWVAQGVDDMDIDSMLYDLLQFSVHQGGVLDSVRYEDWSQQAPGSYQRFQLFLSRQVRDAIQDHDFGETIPFMHSTLGKVVSELKTFMLVGHAKNMLKNLHFRDSTAASLYMVSFAAECMAYSMQSAINYPGELDKKLQPEEIAKAAWFRMSINGLAPLLVETSYNIASGGDSLMSPGTTANTDNRSLFKTPTFQMLSRLGSAPMTITGALLGTDVTTQAEMRDLFRALPFGRLYGLPAFGNWLTESMPKTDPEKRRFQ